MNTATQVPVLSRPKTEQLVDFSRLSIQNGSPHIEAIMGSLGSGKTTTIKHLLNIPGIRVIENDIGRAGFDASVLDACGMEVVALRAGCICCQDLTSLELTLREFVSNAEPGKSAIIIEPTGVAKPEQIRQLLNDLGVAFNVTIMINVKDFAANLMTGRLQGHFEAADKILFSWWDHMEESDFRQTLSSILAYKNQLAPDVPFAFITSKGEIAQINTASLPKPDTQLLITGVKNDNSVGVHGNHKTTIGLRSDLTESDIKSFIAAAKFNGIQILRMKGFLPSGSFHVVGNTFNYSDTTSQAKQVVSDIITSAPIPSWLLDTIRVEFETTNQRFDERVINAQEEIVKSLKLPKSIVSKSGSLITEFEADEGWNYVDNHGFDPELKSRFYLNNIALKCQAMELAISPEYSSDPLSGYYLKRLGGALAWLIQHRNKYMTELGLADRIKATNPATQYFKGLASIQDSMQLGGVNPGDAEELVHRMQMCTQEIGKVKSLQLFQQSSQNIEKIDSSCKWTKMLTILKTADQ